MISMLAQARDPSIRPVSNAPCRVRTVTIQDVTPTLISAWSDLESRAVEPNAYLSPHFVLPAIRYLDPSARIFITLVETGAPGVGDLVGVGVFRAVLGTRRFPIPHLVAYRSRHSFLGGLLLDRERGHDAIDALLDHLYPLRWLWHGLELSDTWGEGPLSEMMKTGAARRGLSHHEWDVRSRAILLPQDGSDLIEKTLKARDKDARRCMRKLEERGRVSWALHRHGPITATAVESFLDLEHRGWKGESRTSLRSNALDEAFFREVVAGFGAVGRALFTELKLDNQVIASTSNFVSGEAGFAFKVGWLPDLAKMSPGVLNEIELLRSVLQGTCSDLKLFDSGAAEGSYIDKLWSGRRSLVSNAIPLSSMGHSVLRVGCTARAVKRRLQSAGWLATESDAV